MVSIRTDIWDDKERLGKVLFLSAIAYMVLLGLTLVFLMFNFGKGFVYFILVLGILFCYLIIGSKFKKDKLVNKGKEIFE